MAEAHPDSSSARHGGPVSSNPLSLRLPDFQVNSICTSNLPGHPDSSSCYVWVSIAYSAERGPYVTKYTSLARNARDTYMPT